VAVVKAAEQVATASPGSRPPVPLLGVLDDTANVYRWRDLPDPYSHYGSHGIVLMTLLQSRSQGVEVCGREGTRKLWSPANVKVYGGGVSETEFLSELSKLIGDHDVPTSSTSSSRSGRSVSHQLRRDRILDVADLGTLPRGPGDRDRLRRAAHPGRPGAVDGRLARSAPPSPHTTPPTGGRPAPTRPFRRRRRAQRLVGGRERDAALGGA